MTTDKEIEESYYYKVIDKLLQKNSFNREMKVLIVGGGNFDSLVFQKHNFKNVILSNIDDSQLQEGEIIDGTQLPYDDSSFDVVVAHATLHHMDRPHSCVCEMYRVAKKIAFFIESQDSYLMRLAVKRGLVELFESNAIRDSNFIRGGINDKPIPNYVYRWSRREIVKLLNSVDPIYKHNIEFLSAWNFNSRRISRRLSERHPILSNKLIFYVIDFNLKVFNFFFRSQGNQFAVIIRKDLRKLHDWIDIENEKHVFNPNFSGTDIINSVKNYRFK